MSSFSADSRQAVGYRQRLFARALVLEDGSGERLALVVVDLGQVSVLLHREVAQQVLRSGTGIGADRLVLSATHTHSGPGNYFAADGFNANAGRFSGFDPEVTAFLVEGITRAVQEAVTDLRPARAGWRFEPVWDFTFNRSYEAYERNSSPRVKVTPGTSRPVDQQAVDSTFALLRVDRCDRRWEACRPWGAYGVFAIHASNIPASNNLFDADVHGIIAETLEDHIRGLRSEPIGPAHFLLAQGALGDISANLRDPTPCRLYRFLPEVGPAGPKTLSPAEAWRAPIPEVESCLDRVRREVDSFAKDLGNRVTGIFDSAAVHLAPDMTIDRSFSTLHLRNYQGPHPICWPPRLGAASVGGAEKGYIRTWKQRLFFFNLGFEEGGSAARATPSGCFGHKKVQLGFLVKDHTLPQIMQLGVYRVGRTLLGTVPLEPTTQVGALIREALLRAGPKEAERALAVSLTNGYALYAASPEEYEAQHYEGGSTLYGPNTAEMLSHELGLLSLSLRPGQAIVGVDSATAYLREAPSHFWRPSPVPSEFRRTVVRTSCGKEELRLRWVDLRPGSLLPSEGPVLELEKADGSEWAFFTDDGDSEIQVRAVEPIGEGYLWEARWLPEAVPEGDYRFRLLPHLGLPEVLTPDCTVTRN